LDGFGIQILKGQKIYRIEYPQKRGLGLIYIWVWLINHIDLIKKADVVHIHDIFIWYLPFRFLFLRKKVILTIHGWEGIYPIPINNIIQKRIASYLSSKKIIVGDYIKKYYKVNADFVTYGGVKRLNLNSITNSNKQIIYIGRLASDTGLEVLLDAYKLIKSRGYVINFCGDGPLRDECSKYGEVLGFVNPSRYLANSEICFASGYLTILEALVMKKYVVVAYNNALKKDYYLLAPFRNWIICGSNSLEISRKILLRKVKNKKDAYNWSKNQTWGKLSSLYQKLWSI
jgi:glycosyltransferase involved in cell wall biosynthesis